MTLEEAFENITDARIERCKKHNLVDNVLNKTISKARIKLRVFMI